MLDQRLRRRRIAVLKVTTVSAIGAAGPPDDLATELHVGPVEGDTAAGQNQLVFHYAVGGKTTQRTAVQIGRIGVHDRAGWRDCRATPFSV